MAVVTRYKCTGEAAPVLTAFTHTCWIFSSLYNKIAAIYCVGQTGFIFVVFVVFV